MVTAQRSGGAAPHPPQRQTPGDAKPDWVRARRVETKTAVGNRLLQMFAPPFLVPANRAVTRRHTPCRGAQDQPARRRAQSIPAFPGPHTGSTGTVVPGRAHKNAEVISR